MTPEMGWIGWLCFVFFLGFFTALLLVAYAHGDNESKDWETK